MKVNRLLSRLVVFCFVLSGIPLIAQEQIDFKKIRNKSSVVSANHSETRYFETKGIYSKPKESLQNWDVSFQHLGIKHGSSIPQSKLDSIKHDKTRQKLNLKGEYKTHKDEVDQKSHLRQSAEAPTIELDFRGNTYNGYLPPDNNIAVSDEGYIVSVANSSIFFADDKGNTIGQESLGNFFDVLGLSGTYFDPKIIYDPIEDKFILVVLNGNTPANSMVAVAFSKTSNPTNGWWLYPLPGDPKREGLWFDYPSIGVSESELYISGNHFDSNGRFRKAIIYQIEKRNGFVGGRISCEIWDGIRDTSGKLEGIIVPISHGFDSSIGPGMIFVSSKPGRGNSVMLYWITGTINDNPELGGTEISILEYEQPAKALQYRTNNLLDAGDTRIRSGFFANNTIHFVMSTDIGDLFTRVYYGRIDLETLEARASTYGLEGFDYAYPAIAPFTQSSSGQTVLVGFLRSGEAIYPEFRVATCDENLNWSNSVLVKQGENFVDISGQLNERWGDYSGISRRHVSGKVEVWVSGCYGKTRENNYRNIWGTWIGKISDGNALIQRPDANFKANITNIIEGQAIEFTDQSSNQPTDWTWSFPGGNPTSSTLQNPSITYNEEGTYDVILVASNAAGDDSKTRRGYITVNAKVIAPVADFEANNTNITENQSVKFTDQSTNDPNEWSWSFPGGNPNSSTSQNPQITYPEAGTYDVVMVASNSAGNDSETKREYITVSAEVLAPVADFEVSNTNPTEGQSVNFTDQSSNTPTEWTWSFPGGNPSSSTAQNPQVTYSEVGTYDVVLVASNSAGNDSETKREYISVSAEVVAPVADFEVSNTSPTEDQSVLFTDQSTNAPTGWVWSFPGGNPSSSTSQNPQVSYPEAGTYDVVLVASNSAGNDSETKQGYMTVSAKVLAPVADFEVSNTSPTEGQFVMFTDKSTNAPTEWVWSFPGGNPNSSTSQNPQISYPEAGTYDVILVASNSAGNDSETKQEYITVSAEAVVPVSDFKADTTRILAGGIIQFSDLSTQSPTNWTWSFPGGTPSTSQLQNPIVVYSEPGNYDVSLVVSNEAGNDGETKSGYIQVGVASSLASDLSPISDFNIFPNPSKPQSRISIQFTLKKSIELDFLIVDQQGKIAKHLLHHKAKQGENVIAFNAGRLSQGVYYIILQNTNKNIIQYGKIIIE